MQNMYWKENRPSMHTSREAWEQSWENDFQRNYRAMAQLQGSISTLLPPDTISILGTENSLISLERETGLLCRLQQDMAEEVATQCAEEDFERKWKDLSPKKREEFVLEGIYRTMQIPDMEERRKWCPDSSLKNLTSRGGDEYLRILRSLLPDDLNTRISEPNHVSHPITDRFFTPTAAESKRGYGTACRTFRTSRTYVLSTIVWNIFLAAVSIHLTSCIWCDLIRTVARLGVRRTRKLLNNI